MIDTPLRTAACLLLLALPVGCGSDSRGDVEAQVEAVLRSLVDADNAADIDAVLASYSDEALLLPPGGEPISGREAIERNYRRLFEASELSLQVASDEIRIGEGWAVVRGRTYGSRSERASGRLSLVDDRFVMLLEREAGQDWRIRWLIWNRAPRG